MAVKAKFIECECGALFQESEEKIVKGEFFLTPWKVIESNKIEPTDKSCSESFVLKFTRNICCSSCQKELARQEKNYEIKPPQEEEESSITSRALMEYYF